VRHFLPRCFFLYVAFTFTLLLFHLLDFLMHRFLHFTLWETIEFVFDESFQNFLNMLDASGISFWVWICAFGFIVFIPIIGVLIYTFTDWIAQKHPFGVPLDLVLQALLCIPVTLFLWDYSASRMVHREAHLAFIKALPWKMTFFRPHAPTLLLPHSFEPPASEPDTLAHIDAYTGTATSLPNIYLFVVESLRSDFIDSSIAPTLSAFRERSVHAPLGLSNANATHKSWFSIFHANFPYYWKMVQQQKWQSGSPPLQLLHKLGYKIHVYSSANLNYYDMDQLLFGTNHRLATTYATFPHLSPKEAWQSDQETLEAYARAKHPSQGQCFIFFWDATHFDYSWPKQYSPHFAPIAKEMNYFQAYLSKKKVELIKNRYRNAVHFIDTLFAQFLSLIPPNTNPIICFTGDHGEEFLEHGHLFHLSQLCDVQTQIPLYFQLPRTPSVIPRFLSQMDIFPTIIDSLTHTPPPFNGQSLFSEHRWPYAVIARYNASRTPTELCFHNGTHKLIFYSKDFFKSRSLRILSIRTAEDKIIQEHKEDLQQWIHTHFDGAFLRVMKKE
jgi:hypothetical protein